MQAELEHGRHAEVPACAPEAPEELGVLVGARTDEAPVRSDELRCDEVVGGEAVLGRQVADPAPERQAAHTGGADDPPGRHEAGRLRCPVEVEPGRPSFGPGDPPVGVHLDATHSRQIDHESVIDHAVPRRVVPAAADRDLQPLCPCEIEGGGNVAWAPAEHDRGGPAVDRGVVADAGGVIAGVARADRLPGERAVQLGKTVSGAHRLEKITTTERGGGGSNGRPLVSCG